MYVTAAYSLELQLKNEINLLNRLKRGEGGGDRDVGRGHGERRPDKQNLMHFKVIKFPGKTPPDIFKQTRIRKEIESRYSQESRTERGFRSLKFFVKIRD